MKSVGSVIRKFSLVVLSLLLVACKSQLQAPDAPPANFKVTAGDSQVVLTWDMEPGLIYDVYYQVGPDVSPGNYIGFATRAQSPFTVTGLVNQTQYAFIVNASDQGSLPGPSTPVVTVTPGGTGAPGQAWTVGAPLFGVGQELRSVAFGNQTYVAVGDGGALYTTNVSNSSSSGIGSWSPVATALPGGLPNFAAVLYTGGGFLTLTSDGHILTSNNTVTWTAQAKVIPIVSAGDNQTNIGVNISDQWTSIAYDGNNYVAAGFNGKIATNHSTTLSSTAWTVKTLPFPNHNELDGISYVNGRFIATGRGGALAVSQDGGGTWTIFDPDTIAPNLKNNTLYAAAFAGGLYLVIGDRGTILFSPDAINWAQETTVPTTQNLYSVDFGNAEFIIVGTAGTILQSPTGGDGTWTATTAGSQALNDVVAGSGVFVAVGDQGATVSGK
jgi:hypothetical protein